MVLLPSPVAWALRPFDGTDADTAAQGEFELEAGVSRMRLGDEDSLAVPSLVFNYGLPRQTEIVLEGTLDHEAGATDGEFRNRLADPALSMKHVWIAGGLQDGTGPSMATECAVLLPESHDGSRFGGECAAIVSQRWTAMVLHLNLGLERSREGDTARSVDLIAEGPEVWRLRPVAELLAEHETGAGGRLDSALLGAIWQHSDDLAFDLGARHGNDDHAHFNELRIGLTWRFAVRG